MGHPALTAGFFGLSGTELIVIGLIVLVLFGSRLPKAARGFGQSIKEFKRGVREGSRAGRRRPRARSSTSRAIPIDAADARAAVAP